MEADVEKLSVDNEVTRAEAEAELERLLVDPEFHCSERNKRFLQFITEKLFEGQEAAIKAYTIAVDVFGRPSNFDPAIDPIVRIEATRLRSSLERYYESGSHRSIVRIALPAGRYVPEFIRRSGVPESVEEERSLPPPYVRPVPEAKPILNRLYPDARARFMAATLGCIGGLAIGAFFLLGHKLTQDEPDVVLVQPAVSIDMLKTERSADVSAMHLRDALIVALARFQTLRILSSTDDGEERQRPGQAKYRVALKYGKDSFGQQLWWQVIDLDGGEILNSGVERIVPGNQDWADPANPVIANLATRLAGDTGIINRAEASAADGAALGNGCIVQAYLAVELADRAALDASRSCLRRTIELRPRDADAKAAMAVALLEPAPSAVPPSIRSQALDLAEQSAMAEPYSSASAYAQMLARYSTGNLDGAIASGQRALVINPYDMKTAAKLGRILTLAGRQDEAVPLLAEASKGEGRAAADAVAMLAFDSYRRGAYDEALRRLQQSAIKDCYVLRMLEIATLGQSGRKADADQVIESTRQSRPDFETGFSAAMKSYSVAPPVASALEEGLKMAGLDPQ